MAQLSITNKRRNCASLYDQQWPLLSEIPTGQPSKSQERVLLRKDGQPDRRQFTNGRPFEEKQQWQLFGEFAVTDICGSVCVVSASDVPFVSQHRWYLLKSGQNHYAATGQGFFMHRMLLGLEKGDKRHADHRDNFGLNNWRDNLRIGSVSQNRSNSRKLKVGRSSKYKGVHLQGSKWAAYCGPRKNRRYLGRFTTEDDAARAYDAAALELFGEFARLNFPTNQKAA